MTLVLKAEHGACLPKERQRKIMSKIEKEILIEKVQKPSVRMRSFTGGGP